MAEETKTVEILEPNAVADLTKQIAEAGEDAGKVTALLMQVTEAYTNLFATHADISTKLKQTQDDNAQLKQYNYDMMVKYGSTITGSPAGGENSGNGPKSDERKRAETITIEDLFKKKEE